VRFEDFERGRKTEVDAGFNTFCEDVFSSRTPGDPRFNGQITCTSRIESRRNRSGICTASRYMTPTRLLFPLKLRTRFTSRTHQDKD